jgi:hypothetical protein
MNFSARQGPIVLQTKYNSKTLNSLKVPSSDLKEIYLSFN